MATILHIDSSARPGRSDLAPHGSHSRRLTAHFIENWRQHRPDDTIMYRDVGANPPAPITGDWIHAAFTKPDQRENWMQDVLAESDMLIDELLKADVIVAGVPMYNFGMPAQMKAWIENIVRVGRTFGFDRSRGTIPYWPMVTDNKSVVVLSSRGDYGYNPGERIAHLNHVEGGVFTPLEYIGITDHHSAAIEYDEFADTRTHRSIMTAENDTAKIVEKLVAQHGT
ncbi:FMN-dependent NADH-azoreductase [Thalassospira sp. MCCC 1A01428]|uniref:FMN-dependent NADH-azoreductase n=1 Tax=Thalassospira sp. MCCC 1A01428 TaxID=1470575 RepID=UPI000A1F0F7C|nr:NAD(P)H-dependent oxidoreductase [Thalassospira sp. MCCC 1A01428]OSQ43457.1 NAD(P)H dehydrogenase [Thalassospira sp. MCCC 1A01428]